MEIKNVTLFLVGIIVLVLGTLIIIFDYPQIEYFENIDFELYYSGLDPSRIGPLAYIHFWNDIGGLFPW